jgi:hypothetical protein
LRSIASIRRASIKATTSFTRINSPSRAPRSYSYVRQGWGRLYADDALYKQARVALERAVAVSPGGKVLVDNDPSLTLKTSDELKAEIDRGLTREAADFNPLRVFDKRP